MPPQKYFRQAVNWSIHPAAAWVHRASVARINARAVSTQESRLIVSSCPQKPRVHRPHRLRESHLQRKASRIPVGLSLGEQLLGRLPSKGHSARPHITAVRILLGLQDAANRRSDQVIRVLLLLHILTGWTLACARRGRVLQSAAKHPPSRLSAIASVSLRP